MKSQKNKSLHLLLQDAMLQMSEQDENNSRELLRLAGADPDALVNGSLSAIEGYRASFEKKLTAEAVQPDLLDSVQRKISRLLSESPEQARSFLQEYFQQHSLTVQFGANAGVNKKTLAKVKDKIDLNDLSRRLDEGDLY